MAHSYHRIAFFSLAGGLLLLGINVAGLFFVSLRNPAIYRETKVRDKDDITLTEEELLRAAERRPDESAEEYVVRLNEAVNKGIAYYWEDEGVEKYNLRVPVYENYLLFLASHVSPGYFRKYEFSDQYKNIERGVGVCSLHAMVIAALLEEHAVDSKVVLLDGHVVALARVSESPARWWVVDADSGVVVKHDLGEIEADTELVKPYYLERGYSQEHADWFARVYGREGNAVFSGARDYLPWEYPFIEYISYLLKWAIPLLLMTPFALSYGRHQYRRAAVSARPRAR
jgi:hypothetical protein